MKFLIPSIVITGLFLSSCATSESFVNDDIYSVRPSELPIGESTADETSYASFKTRKEGQANDRMTYSDEMAMRNRQNCLEQYRWYDGCGCSYTEWLRSSRYSPQNNFNRGMFWGNSGFGMGFAYGNFRPYSYYSAFYPYNSFGGYHPYLGYWGYSSMNMYPYHHSPYMWNDPYFGYGMGFGYPFYGGGMYGYYGYGLGGYGYGGNMNGWSNSGHNNGISSNVIRGPRGTTTSGHYNPAGRATANPAQVLMIKTNNVSRTAPTNARTNTVVKEVENRDVISRPTSPTATRGTSPNSGRVATSPSTTRSDVNRGTTYDVNRRPVEGQRVTTPTNSRVNSDYQRSYPSRENSSPNRGTVGTQSRTSTPSSGGFERSSSPTQSRGTNISSPSRGSSGMGSSPSGGGRTGGSSGSNSGGRR